jgi:hypothetical protein
MRDGAGPRERRSGGERLTKLRDEAESGSREHRELNHELMKARRRLYEIEWGRRERCRELKCPLCLKRLDASDVPVGVARNEGGANMAQRLARHLRSQLIAYLALFVALGGTSIAAVQALPRNSVGSPQIKNRSIQTIDVSRRAVSAL